MLINKNTKISQLINHHKDALQVIVQLSPDFKKLRNPLIRKLMASRTSIAMASKIGGCTPEDFFDALEKLGFETKTDENTIHKTPKDKAKPDFLKSLKATQIETFDVRNLLANGNDPLKIILKKIKQLEIGHALNVINTFEPVPLIALMEKQGFKTYVETIAEDRFDTYFYKTPGANSIKSPEMDELSDVSDWDILLKKFENNLIEIDVRSLEMPEPMIRILHALEDLRADQALYVFHKKVPVFLLNELNDRAFEFRIKNVQEGEVYLLIFKN